MKWKKKRSSRKSDISRLVLEIDSTGVKVAGGNLAEFSKRASESQKAATSLDGVMNQLNLTSIAAGAGILTLYKAFNSLVGSVKSFGSQAVQSFSHFEQIESGLQGVLKDVKKGTAMFEDLRKFSFDTTFGVDTLANAATQLLGVNESASTLKTTLLQLGNVASGDTNKFNELVGIFAKIQNTGKAGSMQLQQLALRGVPIYQYLKKIGVQGTATGEDIRKAFEMMNQEGEVFYNTMGRINDTIQGKEGFISDTWREFLTSFAEASGLADAYKSVLDTVYDALQGVVDWLQKINENPVTQAIFRGVLIGTLTAITALIGGALLIALKQVIAHLTTIAALQAAINPVKTVAGIAIGAGVAAGAFAMLKTTMKKVGDETSNTLSKMKELTSIDLTEIKVDRIQKNIDANNDAIKEATERLKEYQNLQKSMSLGSLDPSSYKSARNWAADMGYTKLLRGPAKELEEAWENAKKAFADKSTPEIDAINKTIDLLKQRNEELEKQLDFENGILNAAQLYEKAKEKAPEYTKQMMSSSEKKLDELLKQYEEMQKFANAKDEHSETHYNYATGKDEVTVIKRELAPEIVKAFEEAGVKFRKQIEETKIKIAVENQGDWRKFLQDTMGFTDKEVAAGMNLNEAKAFKNFNAKTDKQNAKLKQFRNAGLIHSDNLTIANNYLDIVNKIVEAYEKSDQKNIDADSIKKLQDLQAKAIADVFNAQIAAYDKELANFNKSAEEIRREKLEKQGFSPEQAKDLYDKEQQVSQKKDLMAWLKEQIGNGVKGNANEANDEFSQSKNSFVQMFEDIKNLDIVQSFTDFKDGLANAGAGIIDTLQGISIGFASSVVSASGDLQNFAEGFKSGGSVIGGIIATVVGALMNVCKGIDGFDEALNPVTTLFQNLSELIYVLMTIISTVVKVIKALAKIINTILKILHPVLAVIVKLFDAIGKFVDWIADGFSYWMEKIFPWFDSFSDMTEEQKKEAERLKRLRDEYAALYDAMKEQEEYYLKKKNEINADSYNASVTKVNDMILTDKGVFSTDPKDTILAMKRPSDLLGGGNCKIYVTINNNAAGVDVTTQESISEDGAQELIVNISRAVASDYATGANGWDSAYEAQQNRTNGRRVTI